MKFKTTNHQKYTHAILLLIIFCGSLISLISLFDPDSQINLFNENNEKKWYNIPKLSNNGINISTPKNITYTAPMKGYYPATFGFENEEDGNSRQEIEFIDVVSTYGTCEIVESYSDTLNKEHKKILHVEDPSDGPGMYFRHLLDSAQTNGFVEFWFIMTDKWASGADNILFYSMDDSDNIGFLLRFYADQFMDTQSNTAPMSYNNWYHILIEFNCFSGTNGLFNWYLNGVLQYSDVEMDSNLNEITQLAIRGYSASRGEGYFDAFGFSWDTDYNIGDNFKEGLLLSYENSTNLDWMGYSLNGEVNKTIIGNTVFPLSGNGVYNLRVYGRNSSGYIFESPICYFTIDIPAPQILIFSPDNGAYFGSSAPSFSISIITPILDTSWYSLDNGITKIIFNGPIGTIDQSEWNRFGDGLITIVFYINDTFGREVYSDVSIYKDQNLPQLPPYTFLVILIIVTVVGFTVLNVIVLQKARRKRKKKIDLFIEKDQLTEQLIFRCPTCNSLLTERYNYCIYCGSKLRE
jgi:hypothetical protein